MSATNEQSVRQTAAPQPADLGPMPVWDLRDLYPGPQSKEVEADLKRAAAGAKRFKETYEGKLAALAKEGAPFGEAIAAYERLGETLGRLGSYAGLLYAADRANPEHARFYGNIQEQLTAISTRDPVLRAGDQPHGGCGAGRGPEGAVGRPLQAVAGGPAQGEALSAGGAPGAPVPREARSPRAPPGIACSTRPWRRCATT